MTTTAREKLADGIVDAALEIADERGWDAVRLHDVADRLGVGLPRIRACYPDRDAVADAWLGRADDAMLLVRERPGFADLPARERLQAAMGAWFNALGARRRILRSVLIYKLQPPHLHLQAGLVVATSRRVQWLREAAGLDAEGLQCSIEETGLTALFVAAVGVWLTDDSDDYRRTRKFIAHRLQNAENLMQRLFRG